MKSFSSLEIVLVCLLVCVKYATSILCYDCNSAFDPRCGEEFDPFSLGIVNCSLKDPPEHLHDVEPSFCRSIKIDMKGKMRVVRQCGYLPDETPQKCRRQVGTNDLFVTYCTCDTDLCNTGRAHRCSTAMLLIAVFSVIF